MNSYKELLQQREALDKQIEEARHQEISAALEKVRSLVTEFGLTADDVFTSARKTAKPGKTGMKVAAKYRNPATGDTWTGRGKPPKWIEGQERTQYLIG